MGATQALREREDVPFFEMKKPENEMVNTTARFPRWMLKKLQVITDREKAKGSISEWTRRGELSRDDVMRTACKLFIEAYEAEHGEIEVTAESPSAAPAKKKPAAKKGGKG
ncbi:primary repressor Imm [Myxococcus phage Mx8]|uniref:Imm n=1 Tax=Myxococcus phage Mx8 TaxID=49964 RepID=O03952_9CAUD|nr:primary repressor Imm [Myxococcus phage Mx8]AAC48896.1 Imm [Myxococcus phage Mx8]AAK94336.1 primary repressor Imm [Myxococcus phage Mx8]